MLIHKIIYCKALPSKQRFNKQMHGPLWATFQTSNDMDTLPEETMLPYYKTIREPNTEVLFMSHSPTLADPREMAAMIDCS